MCYHINSFFEQVLSFSTVLNLVLVFQDFWILGGEDDQAVLDSTEILDSKVTGQWKENSPKIPRSLSRHCVVKINETHVFISGGEKYY